MWPKTTTIKGANLVQLSTNQYSNSFTNMESNILFVDKPQDLLSRRCMFKACGQLQIKVKKKGIEGILDPFASGLLIIGTGHATRYLRYFLPLRRTYHASLRLGVATDTLDHTGNQIDAKESLTSLNRNMVVNALQELTGELTQYPPIFSNIKIGGVPARTLARQGKQPEIKPRQVDIFRLELLDFNQQEIKFLAEVSSGTYIRSLGLSIAQKLGTTGHLTYLRRKKIGKFGVESIKYPIPNNDDLKNTKEKPIRTQKILLAEALYWFDEVILSHKEAMALQQGKKILETETRKPGIYKVRDTKGSFYGLAERKENYLSSHKMLPLILPSRAISSIS